MPKILYVEDNDDNLYMLSLRFETLDGYEIVSAVDGAEGYSKATTERPDLILMDLNLPVMDGWELMRRLKENAGTRSIPVIALTAHAMLEDRARCLAAGCDEYLTKPVDPALLYAAVERLCALAGRSRRVA